MAAETDKRELILERLKVLFAAVEGIKKVVRNSLDVPEKDRPAVVILDADEASEDEVADGRGRPAGAVLPVIVSMTPEIFIVTGHRAANIGTELNALRFKLLKAVLRDETLLSLVKDGDIKFLGFATGLAAGRSMEGEAGISFSFRYLIQPSKL